MIYSSDHLLASTFESFCGQVSVGANSTACRAVRARVGRPSTALAAKTYENQPPIVGMKLAGKELPILSNFGEF